MAERDFTVSIPVDAAGNNIMGALLVVWTGLTGTDTGKAYVCPHRAEKSVQVTGTYATATVNIQGTNQQCYDSAGTALSPTWGNLSDIEGAVVAISSGNVPLQLQENTLGVRPSLSGGGGGDSLTVSMLISSPARL